MTKKKNLMTELEIAMKYGHIVSERCEYCSMPVNLFNNYTTQTGKCINCKSTIKFGTTGNQFYLCNKWINNMFKKKYRNIRRYLHL